MKAAKQLSVMLPNEPGQLAMLCKKLATAKVNIKAISVVNTTEQSTVRLVVDKPLAARKAMKSARLLYVESDVILSEMTNKPGVLAGVAAKLARAKVNIQYVYGSTARGTENGVLVFAVDNVAKAKKLL